MLYVFALETTQISCSHFRDYLRSSSFSLDTFSKYSQHNYFVTTGHAFLGLYDIL